ncbi:MAG: bifunctional demethylmenaquinone methyltransferase/2-methoxy-6-polyprenyl-1,4-benzoquinol methylase UbiE [Acidobacteriota bacterium]
MKASGAAPSPIDPEHKRGWQIRRMFGAIAPRYDLLNHLLSANMDRVWRRAAVRRVQRALPGTGGPILDLCTGTGDLAVGLARLAPVVGCDFCHPMLKIADGKIRRLNLEPKVWLAEGDALALPFGDCRFAAVTVAFGLRNLEDLRRGLGEIHRVLQPGGVAAILEFSTPSQRVFRRLYFFYFRRILPRIGRLISGEQGPYSYLPESVERFPDQERLRELMISVGFEQVTYDNLTGGIAALHVGVKRG